MGKTDQILIHIIGMKSHLGSIDEHLKNLNSRTEKNEIKSEENDTRISKVEKRMAYYLGGGTVLLLVFGFLFNLLIKYKIGG